MGNKPNNSDLLAKCAACEEIFTQEDILVLEEGEQRSVFHATCQACKSATMIYLSAGNGGVMSVGVVTDLDRDEVEKMFQDPAVNTDEVIAMHEVISANEGGMAELLRRVN
jgi:hypothetical protein